MKEIQKIALEDIVLVKTRWENLVKPAVLQGKIPNVILLDVVANKIVKK